MPVSADASIARVGKGEWRRSVAALWPVARKRGAWSVFEIEPAFRTARLNGPES